jgi:geranylgeranyl diphosphate synthase type I
MGPVAVPTLDLDPPPDLNAWLKGFGPRLERELRLLLWPPDEAGLDATWTAAQRQVVDYALRPAKRIRPALLAIGHALASGSLEVTPQLLRAGAGLELLHTFLLIHDDVADRADTRRGGPALHHLLGHGKLGEDLAVVAGDHLYARSIEVLLGAAHGQPEALFYLLRVCRHTALGQHLDLEASQYPLRATPLRHTLKIAALKTAQYGFVAPLVCGAILAGADASLKSQLVVIGRHLGLAFQLTDDLIGLYGDDAVAGKSGGADYFEGKRTFPVIAAFQRATEDGRARLEKLWAHPHKGPSELSAARLEIRRHGGVQATERLVQRCLRIARLRMAALEVEDSLKAPLALVLDRIAGRGT